MILADHSIADNFWCDHGICSQTILLGARACGLAGCIFGAVNKKQLSRELEIPEHLEIKLVLAIGKPVEEQQIDPVGEDGDIRYFRDKNQVHHVPKRDLNDLIIQSW